MARLNLEEAIYLTLISTALASKRANVALGLKKQVRELWRISKAGFVTK